MNIFNQSYFASYCWMEGALNTGLRDGLWKKHEKEWNKKKVVEKKDKEEWKRQVIDKTRTTQTINRVSIYTILRKKKKRKKYVIYFL